MSNKAQLAPPHHDVPHGVRRTHTTKKKKRKKKETVIRAAQTFGKVSDKERLGQVAPNAHAVLTIHLSGVGWYPAWRGIDAKMKTNMRTLMKKTRRVRTLSACTTRRRARAPRASSRVPPHRSEDERRLGRFTSETRGTSQSSFLHCLFAEVRIPKFDQTRARHRNAGDGHRRVNGVNAVRGVVYNICLYSISFLVWLTVW